MSNPSIVSRRAFLGGTLAATAAGAWLGALRSQAEDKPAEAAQPPSFPRQIKLGVVGLGGRGRWIAGLFRRHGGFALHAVADYFPQVADAQGQALGVDGARRFSGLSGYKKLIESGIEAIAIEDVPYFYPEQARAAVEAGLHVYIAKPVAVDVPGVLSIGASGTEATRRQRVFLVDYQMPTDPWNVEVSRRVTAGGLGPLQTVFTAGGAGGAGFNDPPLTANLESRLRDLVWVNDDALGCGYIGNYDIHVVDAVLRPLGRRPVAAFGWGARFRGAPHGDSQDSLGVMYFFEDGLVWNHQSPKGICDDWFSANGSLAAEIQGRDAAARLSYWGKAYVRGGPQAYSGGKVENLYEAGAIRNIAAFYEHVTQGHHANETVRYAVDSTLVCILGREAAARRTRLTLDQVIQENRRLEVDLKGLKA